LKEKTEPHTCVDENQKIIVTEPELMESIEKTGRERERE